MGTQHLRETLKKFVNGESAQAALQARSERSSCCGPVPSAPEVEDRFLSVRLCAPASRLQLKSWFQNRCITNGDRDEISHRQDF